MTWSYPTLNTLATSKDFPKRRRAKQPTKTDILRVEEGKAVEANAEETDDVDQSPKNSTEINPTDYETTDMQEEYPGIFLDTLVVSDSEYENPVIEARGEWWLNTKPDDFYSGPDLLDCKVCQVPMYENVMEMHVKSRHPECSKCGMKWRSKKGLTNHRNKEHIIPENQTKKSVCPKCSNTFGSNEDLQQHLMTIHTCNVCKKIYKSPHTLMNHYKTMHKESPEYNKYHEKFQTKYNLNTHFENTHKILVDRELSE